MAPRHKTMRGIPIDMAALAAHNAKAPALGNAKMNARGDRLGQGGIVLKTQEQIEADWKAEKDRQSLTAGRPSERRVDIKAPLPTIVDHEADKDFHPNANEPIPPPVVVVDNRPEAKRRKITDAE